MTKIWKTFDLFEESVMVAGMAMMVLFNFLNVIFRYLLPQTPFSYTEELVVLLFIWVSMFGISKGYRIGSHTVLTVLTDCIPNKFQPVVIAFSGLTSALLMSLLAYTGYGMVMNQIKHGQILPGMRIPMAVVGWAVPIGAVVAVISIIKASYAEIEAVVLMERTKGGADA